LDAAEWGRRYNSVVWVWVVLRGGVEVGLLRWARSVGIDVLVNIIMMVDLDELTMDQFD